MEVPKKDVARDGKSFEANREVTFRWSHITKRTIIYPVIFIIISFRKEQASAILKQRSSN